MFRALPIQGVLFTVFQSILQVFLLCLAGFTLSYKGIVDKSTSKTLNHLNIALFTPALLFSKVAFFLSPAKLRQLWIIPIFFTIVTILSALVARCLAQMFRLKRSQVNFATAASMFMNSNSLPVALMQSLVATVPLLKWGSDDTFDAMFGRSLTYLVIFSTLGMMLRWSYGVRLLSSIDEEESHVPTPSTYRDDTDQLTLPVNRPAISHYDRVDPHDQTKWRVRTPRSSISHPRISLLARRHTVHVHPHSHLPAVPTSLGDQSESEESDEVDTTEGESEDTIALQSEPTIDTGFSTETEGPAKSSPSKPISDRIPRWDTQAHPPTPPLYKRFFNMLTSLSPPLVGSLLAIVVVLIPPLQRLLQSAEMSPFKEALDNAGACSIPLTMIVLGGWFCDGESDPKSNREHVNSGEEVKRASSRSQDSAKRKGKGVQDPLDRDDASSLGETRITERTMLRPRHRHHHHYEPSRNSSTTSLSSIVGAFSDVLMARRGAKRHAKNVVASSSQGDIEQGRPSAQHSVTEMDDGNDEPRSRSRTDSVNGCARPLPSISATTAIPAVQVPAPQPDRRARGAANPPGETLTIILTLLARMVIVPLIATPSIVLISRMGWGGDVFKDPVFIVSSMLLVSSPPALTLAQISQRKKSTGNDGEVEVLSPFERLLSRTVFWSYLVLTPPVTIASVMVGLMVVEYS